LKKQILLQAVVCFLLFSCASMALAASDIPKATWSRPIGLPLENPGVTKDPGLIDDGYWQGAPVGGMGAGTFSRSYRGDFSIAGCMGHPIFCSRYRTRHLSSDSQTASRLLEMTKERPVTSFRLVLLDETGWLWLSIWFRA
jgi:hypothetical protein